MPCPPMPFVPEEYHGRLIVMGMLAFIGSAEAGERVIAPFRSLATPLADLVRPMPYPEIYPPEDESYHPKAVGKTFFMKSVDRSLAETIVERLEASDAAMRVAQIRVLGGAMARVPADATAFAHRASRIITTVAAFYDGPADRPARQAWVDRLRGAARPGRPWRLRQLPEPAVEDRVRAAYPGATWDRLAAIKAEYDPTNLFARNQNVPPAAD